MASALAVGLLSNLYGLLVEQLRLTRSPPTWPTFLDGKVTSEIADTMAKTPLPSGAAALERGASWLVTGDLGARVRQGCDGWLFLADELTPHPHAQANARERAAIVADIRSRLAARQIALLVVVVPDKTRIAADHACGLTRPAAYAGRTRDWIAALHAAGVPALDLEPALRATAGPGFLRTDTHWNEAGAEAAAAATARQARALPSAPDFLQPRQRFTAERGEPAPLWGDLVRLAGIDWLPAALLPPPDQETTTKFAAMAGDSAAGAPSEEDLFGDTALPRIALVGTSFSHHANFIPFLERALETRVADFAREGGEFAGSAQAYFASEAFAKTPPRLLIWEIPERSLQRPLAGETAIWPAKPVPAGR